MNAEELRAQLLRLTERYCVVLQTLLRPPALDVELAPGRDTPARG